MSAVNSLLPTDKESVRYAKAIQKENLRLV